MSETDADRYPFGYRDEELERLGDQHQVWEEENQGFLSRAGFKEGDTYFFIFNCNTHSKTGADENGPFLSVTVDDKSVVKEFLVKPVR